MKLDSILFLFSDVPLLVCNSSSPLPFSSNPFHVPASILSTSEVNLSRNIPFHKNFEDESMQKKNS
jgi:hypothetical protein